VSFCKDNVQAGFEQTLTVELSLRKLRSGYDPTTVSRNTPVRDSGFQNEEMFCEDTVLSDLETLNRNAFVAAWLMCSI
jgi:hypothetical protein